MGEAKTIIGSKKTRDLQAGILKIDQKGCIKGLLEFEGMSSCHPIIFSMKAGSSLILDQAGDHLPTNMVVYQRLVKKLMYLACGARPDIAFVVGQLSRHNCNPQAGHICIAEQTLRYLKRTSSMGDSVGKSPCRPPRSRRQIVRPLWKSRLCQQQLCRRHWWSKVCHRVLLLLWRNNYHLLPQATANRVDVNIRD